MIPDMFELNPITQIRLDDKGLQQALLRLDQLTSGMERGSLALPPDALEDLRNRLRVGLPQGKSFAECTAVKRRESMLLGLYLNDLNSASAQAWLPALDQYVLESILGTDPKALKFHLLRKATQLYFTHYGKERIPCLDMLCALLESAWRFVAPERLDAISKVWAENAQILFAPDALEKVAETWTPGTSVQNLADHFEIHEDSLFRENLFEELILSRLRKVPLNESDSELNELVIAEKERVLASGLRLGAASVRVLINRSQQENHSVVPDCWADQLVTFACDPRIPNSDMRSRWWGWATSYEKDLAIRALSKISLEEFIRLLEQSLEGTAQGRQFVARRRFLMKLFDMGLVIEARLVIPRNLYLSLNAKTREVLAPSWLSGSQDTSFVCLRCSDNVYLIEGTHSFALRGFIGVNAFPIKGYWDDVPRQYSVPQFRVSQSDCQLYQIHHGSYWPQEFHQQLRRQRIEWDIFR
jgi:hypothetical protein